MKIRYWLDSGANIHSKRERVVDLESLGLTQEEWDEMDEQAKDDFIQASAWEAMDWGWVAE